MYFYGERSWTSWGQSSEKSHLALETWIKEYIVFFIKYNRFLHKYFKSVHHNYSIDKFHSYMIHFNNLPDSKL